jgi:hypothetical protein
MTSYHIAVVGAGIYGSSIAIELARAGHSVTLFDPMGVLACASSINQFRIHKGYHYPRSYETIEEVLQSRIGFLETYGDAVAANVENYYAIPHENSLTPPARYEEVLKENALPFEVVRPDWVNYDFIDRCYQVDEEIYDPDLLRNLLETRIDTEGIKLDSRRFEKADAAGFDFVVHATYGASGSHMHLFDDVRIQIVEKIKISIPAALQRKSLVVVDGPFTAFDPYGSQPYAQFGSAKHTNHWVSDNPEQPFPNRYRDIMNLPDFCAVSFTHFDKMLEEAALAVPLCSQAQYVGSRFTCRLVEHAPASDRRVMRIGQPDEKNIHVFSGKVVSAIKAADNVCDLVANA